MRPDVDFTTSRLTLPYRKKYNFYSAKIYFSFKNDDIIEDIKNGLEGRKLFNYEIIKKDNNIKLILTKK